MSAISVEQASFPQGFKGEWHRHKDAQLIYPGRGIMLIETRAGGWIVPPLRACWLPADEEHRVQAPVGLKMLSGYCRGNILKRLPRDCGIVQATRLLREVMLALVTERRAVEGRRLAAVLADQIILAKVPLLFLPQVSSVPLKRIEAALKENPGDQRKLPDWAKDVGLSSRTLARKFERETGMTFSFYRAQIRLLMALQKIAGGESVTNTAHDIGFHSTSSFIAAFRKATGSTPKAYFNE